MECISKQQQQENWKYNLEMIVAVDLFVYSWIRGLENPALFREPVSIPIYVLRSDPWQCSGDNMW